MSHIALLILALVLMAPGLLGLIIPVIPAIPYLFVITVIFGFIDKFTYLSGRELAVLGILTLLSLLVDHLSGILGAKFGGATRKAMLFGFIGALAGTFILPPFGGMPGLFFGILVGELSQYRTHRDALRAATGGVLGSLAGMTLNIAVAILYITLFIIFALHQ